MLFARDLVLSNRFLVDKVRVYSRKRKRIISIDIFCRERKRVKIVQIFTQIERQWSAYTFKYRIRGVTQFLLLRILKTSYTFGILFLHFLKLKSYSIFFVVILLENNETSLGQLAPRSRSIFLYRLFFS